jgi:hypothetical protein
LIWETPEKGAPVFVDGFPPPEIKEVLADTSIPQDDKEWLLNNIRVWAAYKTKQLWLTDGSTMEIPAVRPGDKVSTFTVYTSRNKKYWLVRAMRIEGPGVPSKPPNPTSREEARDPEYWEKMNTWHTAQSAQKAHWREAFMDVEGRIYWEKEFGPYDTHLEDQWYGEVVAHISDDGEVVVKIGARKGWFCGKVGECVERDGFSYLQRTALSADGSTFVVHGGTRFSTQCRLRAFDRAGERLWESEPVKGRDLSPTVLAVAGSGQAAVFSVGRQEPGAYPEWSMHLVDSRGGAMKSYRFGEHPRVVVFTPEGNRLVVATARAIRMLEVGDGRELWQRRVEKGWQGMMERASACGRLLVVSAYGDARCTPSNGELFVFDCEGVLMWHRKRPTAEVFLSPNGAILLEKAGGLKFSRLVVEE